MSGRNTMRVDYRMWWAVVEMWTDGVCCYAGLMGVWCLLQLLFYSCLDIDKHLFDLITIMLTNASVMTVAKCVMSVCWSFEPFFCWRLLWLPSFILTPIQQPT